MSRENAFPLIRESSRRRPGAQVRTSRALTLEISAWEYVWLTDYQRGMSVRAIARRDGVAVDRVWFGIARAGAPEPTPEQGKFARPPRLIPLFPIGSYTPQSPCPHREPIPLGSNLCCMVCFRSGMDHHPALQRNPATDPPRAPVPAPAPPVEKSSPETRRQRRQRLFAARVPRPIGKREIGGKQPAAVVLNQAR
jgi:hypothetical protein